MSCTGLGHKIYLDVNSSGSCHKQFLVLLRFCSCASDKAAIARRRISDSCGRNTVTIASPDCPPAAVRTPKQSNVQPQRQSCSPNIRFQPIVNNAIKGPFMPQRTVSLFGVNFDELNARGEPECLAAGCEPGAGDSGYQGTNPMAERASLSGPGAAWIKCPHILRGGHSLCMSSTFKIMSFLSKGLPEGPLPGFGGRERRGWERNIFKALKKRLKGRPLC